MTHAEATALILPAFPSRRKEVWADLGCGPGVFTYALASFLETGSKVYALDKLHQNLKPSFGNAEIIFRQSDFEKEELQESEFDGFLMANSLHYVRDKQKLILRLKNALGREGKILLVEYDTDQANQWVPYPLSFVKVKTLFEKSGFKAVVKVGERQSVYRANKIYACLVSVGHFQ